MGSSRARDWCWGHLLRWGSREDLRADEEFSFGHFKFDSPKRHANGMFRRLLDIQDVNF
jgi:hypothetical protein